MKSNWEITKQRSKYHFRTDVIDPQWDTVVHLGRVPMKWDAALDEVVAAAYPVSWRTRGKPGDAKARSSEEHDMEEYDLESYGMNKDYAVTNMNYTLPKVFQDVANQFGLDDCMARVHVQMPGQVWNLHLDKLEKWMPSDPSKVARYFIQLTDWQQGHFWSYGNFIHTGWKAGDVHTFDWMNVPHCTANAGHTVRATLQVTGIKTDKTTEYLEYLKLYA